jgi:hypothetical protein
VKPPRGPAAGPVLVGIAALAGVATVARASMPLLAGPDAFWHWDLGRRIVASGLPRTDPYSFLTEGRTWVLNQWGADAIFGVADRVGGLPLLAILTALLVGGGIALIGREMYRTAPSLTTVGVLALVVAASLSNWSLRGNLFTFLLIPLMLHELGRDDRRPWPLLLLLIAWANLHATFVLGVALVLIDSVGRWLVATRADRRRLVGQGAGLVIGAVLAGCVTPYGPRYLVSIVQLVQRDGAGILEWRPPDLLSPAVLPFTLLVALVLVASALSARRDDLPGVLLIVATMLFGMTAIRNVAPAAIVVGILGARHVQRAWGILRDRPQTAPVGATRLDRRIAVAVGVASVVLAMTMVPRTGAIAAHADRVPLDAINQFNGLAREARVMTLTSWAPAVAALTGEHVRTAVDGRIELFTDEEFRQVQVVLGAGHGWEQILDAWCVTDLLVPAGSTLEEAAIDTGTWTHVQEHAVVGAPDLAATWLTRVEGLPHGCSAG